jgi:hypothetical protein
MGPDRARLHLERIEPRQDEPRAAWRERRGRNPHRRRRRKAGDGTREAIRMMDVVSIGLTVVFFALSVAFVALCERL